MNYDVLIVGTGIAGLYTALNLRDDIRTLMITKNSFRDCNSYLAQGGISTSLGLFDEENYFNDTVKAGNYHNDTKAVKLLIKNSIENINTLIKLGVPFDKTKEKLNYTREGGHSEFRIVHVKDETGKSVTETLLNIVSKKRNITMLENTALIDLICKDNTCYGGILRDSHRTYKVNSKFTILATGGIGGIFNSTTNVEYLTGDGLNISLKHNIEIKDIKFTDEFITKSSKEYLKYLNIIMNDNNIGIKFHKEIDEIQLKNIESNYDVLSIMKMKNKGYSDEFLEDFITKSQEHLYIDGIVSCPYIEENVIKDILILVPKNELINAI